MADPQRPNAAPVPAGPPGYTIKPPIPSTAPTPAAPVAPAATSVPPPLREPVVIGGLTQNGAIIGAAVMLGLVVVFFFLKGAVRSHLIANKASLASANGASWALFAFLFVAAFTVVFGLIGQFWAALSFIVPLGVLSLITLVLFVVLFNSATRAVR